MCILSVAGYDTLVLWACKLSLLPIPQERRGTRLLLLSDNIVIGNHDKLEPGLQLS